MNWVLKALSVEQGTKQKTPQSSAKPVVASRALADMPEYQCTGRAPLALNLSEFQRSVQSYPQDRAIQEMTSHQIQGEELFLIPLRRDSNAHLTFLVAQPTPPHMPDRVFLSALIGFVYMSGLVATTFGAGGARRGVELNLHLDRIRSLPVAHGS